MHYHPQRQADIDMRIGFWLLMTMKGTQFFCTVGISSTPKLLSLVWAFLGLSDNHRATQYKSIKTVSISYKDFDTKKTPFLISNKNFHLKSDTCKPQEIISSKADVAPQWSHNQIIRDFYFSDGEPGHNQSILTTGLSDIK